MFGNFLSPVRRSVSRGFTLIELMIVVAIVAILGAIAYPAYRDYAIRGSLTDAATGLTSVRADMEAYYQNFRTYAASAGATPPCSAAQTFGKFTIQCAAAPGASSYTISATSTDNILKSFKYSITEKDVRSTDTAPTGWNTCTSKWLMRKGDTC